MKRQETISTAAKRIARTRVLRVGVFLVALFGFAILSFIIPLRPTHSDMENRDLADFPAFSVEALTSGSYFDDINTWFADTFPLRDSWMAASNAVKSLYGTGGLVVHGDVGTGDEIPDAPDTTVSRPSRTTATGNGGTGTTTATSPIVTTTTSTATSTTVSGTTATKPTTAPEPVKPETIGAILVYGDSGYEYYHFVQSPADTYIAAVNRLGAQLKGVANVYDMVVPTSIDICVAPDIRAQVNSSDQKKAIDYIYGSLSADVYPIELFELFTQLHDEGEYLYFRTDHHWTALGAYRAYEQYCAARGASPTPIDAFRAMNFDGYLGSFYRDTQSTAMEGNPDVVNAFVPPSTNTITITNTDGETYGYPIVTDVTDWIALYKYNTFIGGDNPLGVIHNPNKADGSACLLIKESFGNAYAPFLTEDYETVYVLDYRYFSDVDSRSIQQFVKDNGITDVLLLNNISATRNSMLMDELNELIR